MGERIFSCGGHRVGLLRVALLRDREVAGLLHAAGLGRSERLEHGDLAEGSRPRREAVSVHALARDSAGHRGAGVHRRGSRGDPRTRESLAFFLWSVSESYETTQEAAGVNRAKTQKAARQPSFVTAVNSKAFVVQSAGKCDT